VAQGEVPEFKPQCRQKKAQLNEFFFFFKTVLSYVAHADPKLLISPQPPELLGLQACQVTQLVTELGFEPREFSSSLGRLDRAGG
jgi:hypothetical protein